MWRVIGPDSQDGMRWQWLQRATRPKALVGHPLQLPVAALLMAISVFLNVLDHVTPPNLAVAEFNALVIVIAAYWLSGFWTLAMYAVVNVGFVVSAVVTLDKHYSVAMFLIIVTAILGLFVNSTANAARRRMVFSRYLADQLRTPITLLRGYVSMASAGDIPPEKALKEIDSASVMLSDMVEGGIERGAHLAGAPPEQWRGKGTSTPAL